jgi:amino acid adenylation domain-containing protein/non-ribosomal peptide synthase protein (TIGR01720 family)
LGWEYAADLFDASTIERMAEHFEVLLQGIIANPQAKVSRLPLLTAAEKNRLLVEWNDTAAHYPRTLCMHELFEEQAAQNPSTVALVFGNQRLTYGQLNEQANRLAHYLIEERGVKPDTPVGICVERSPEMVVGMLGILKAGGAYVPLDPEYPEQRVQYMLEDAGLDTVLTQKHVRAKLGIGEKRAVCLEDEAFRQRLVKHKATNPSAGHLGLTSDHLAYVIYTSGSTGKPKGVAIEHHSPVAFISWALSVYSREELAGVLAATSICFDLSVYEIFVTLASGGKIILVPHILALSDLSDKESITLINTVPSAIAELVKLKAIPDSVQTINLAGEPLLPALVDKIYTESPVQKVYDLYGPSEDTTYSTFILRKKNSPQTIGRPIANTRVYILDQCLGLRPMGVPGELHIGGPGLARGYFNKPELTREKFIANPFYDKDDPASSERLYKTGDLVRWLPDGNLEFLGRIDHQVKIRGFRIELGEIEHALLLQPQIKEAVVVAHARDGGEKYLVAYVAPQALSDPAGRVHLDHDVLRQALRTKLPEYMVPAYFVEFDALPLTPNGKVDRKALLPPDASQLQTKDYVAPNTEAEKQLVQIWSKVLNVPAGKIGTRDNFFELGGDSLLAMQMVSKANQAGIGITLKQIHSAATLAELASLDNPRMNAIDNVPVVGDVPLTIDQAVFLGYDYRMPEWGIILNHYEQAEAPDPAILEEAVNALLAHHDGMRARFVREESVWRQIIDEPRRHKIVSAIDVSHLDVAAAEQRVNDIAHELVQSFDLSTGPLIKIVQIDFGAGRPKRVLFAVHHLICDGYSVQILYEDIATACQQLLENRPVRLPEKTTPVKDWIARLQEYANSDALKQEARYWRNLPWNDIPKLPIDFPGGEYKRYEGSHIEIPCSLSEQDTLRIMNDLPRRYGVSTFDAIAAALVATLSTWMQSEHVPLYVLDSGRNVLPDMQGIDLSRTVGWLSYPRLALLQQPQTEDVSTLLKSVSMQLKSLPHQGSGFGILSAYSEDKAVRDMLRTIPVPQVWLNFIGVYAPVFPQNPLNKIVWAPPGGGERRNIDITWIHPDNQEAWHILLKSGISNNRFHMIWRYSENLYRRETIETLAENYLAVLRAMIALPKAIDCAGSE